MLERLIAALGGPQPIRTQGLKGSARGYVLSQVAARTKRRLVCVAADEDAADQLATDLAFFMGGPGNLLTPTVLRLPADEVLPYEELSPNARVTAERVAALFHLRQGTPCSALVLSVRALHRKMLPPTALNSLSELIGVGQDYERDTLARKLSQMGYGSTPLVEDPGTFSVRGGIVDIFSPLYPQPVRLEFFGDTVESMRTFDSETQRTIDSLKELYLPPAREVLFTEATQAAAEKSIRALADHVNLPTAQVRGRLEQIRESIPAFGIEALLPGFFEGGLVSVLDYLPFWSATEPIVYWDNPLELERAAGELESALGHEYELAEKRSALAFPPAAHFFGAAEVRHSLAKFSRIEGGGLSFEATFTPETSPPIAFQFGGTQEIREAILSHHGEDGALSPLVDRLSQWRDMKVASVIACGTLGQADRLKRLLLDRNVMVKVHPEPLGRVNGVYEPAVFAHLFPGEISQGFTDTPSGFALISDEEIFGVRARRKVRSRKSDQPFAAAFKDLSEGDLVVHTDFGIARYAGLTTMQVRGVPGDFLVLEYAGRDKVYLPVGRMRLIQKFTGGDPTKISLDKLGTATWEKTKKRVKENLLKMAAELLRIYAARKAHPGFKYSEPEKYFRQFEADFEFEETPDQAKAIEDVLSDMLKAEPMDRLVCGDVGYGKTEVAMRAAFKATLDKKQVAVLVPTTVLAQQHYLSFRKRFADYPVVIEVMSRMKKPQEVREILKRTKEGKVDILIGTHKLLGGEVGFHDLGMLIVDEEQRFGVKQKEQLKSWRTQVDVLTLTATPIPRTLNMAMSGIRDMSIIATPPQDRRAIRTFVIKFDAPQIREAILREVHRGGQVFFVHNRVQSIHSMQKFLHELVPEVSIGLAHGQMGEGQLEKVMLEFVDKKHQVLLCTSIIESGIDISSANTMIVNRADAFGLSQLYQLRGRVGRSKERAYAYLMVPARRTITRDAQRRLEVLQAFTELGAGFTVASHDMEIRGAGNLLGANQSGAIAEIGFDLYTQLLEEAVAEMRGEPPKVQIEPEINLPLPALIPEEYVPDVHQRLVFYKRFSQASSDEEVSDLRAELVDRFGEAPTEVDNLSEVTSLKVEMRELQLRSMESGPAKLVLSLGTEARLDAVKLTLMIQKSKGGYRLTPDMKLMAKVPENTQIAGWLAEAKKVMRDLSAVRNHS